MTAKNLNEKELFTEEKTEKIKNLTDKYNNPQRLLSAIKMSG